MVDIKRHITTSKQVPYGQGAKLLIAALLIAALLLPGLMNRLDELYPTSAAANWYGDFKLAFPGLGLDRLALLSPKKYGTGYWLGVLGSVILVVLLMYSARKRWSKLHSIGLMGRWLGLHIVLGAFVPVLILYHSNFRFGALNSNVALVSMLIISVSGIIGRYLFMRVHTALQKQRAIIRAQLAHLINVQGQVCDGLAEGRALMAQLQRFGDEMLSNKRAMAPMLLAALPLARIGRRNSAEIMARNLDLIRRRARDQQWPSAALHQWVNGTGKDYRNFNGAVRKASRLAVVEHVLSFWDPLHLPLSIIMVLAALAHIIVVHTY